MSSTRMWLRLLALAVILDLAVVLALRATGAAVLLPPVLGTALASLGAWSDAGSTRRRRLLAVLATVATGGILGGLMLALTAGLSGQAVLLTALLVVSAVTCVRGWQASGRRRLRASGYYTPDPAPRRMGRRLSSGAMGLGAPRPLPARVPRSR